MPLSFSRAESIRYLQYLNLTETTHAGRRTCGATFTVKHIGLTLISTYHTLW